MIRWVRTMQGSDQVRVIILSNHPSRCNLLKSLVVHIITIIRSIKNTTNPCFHWGFPGRLVRVYYIERAESSAILVETVKFIYMYKNNTKKWWCVFWDVFDFIRFWLWHGLCIISSWKRGLQNESNNYSKSNWIEGRKTVKTLGGFDFGGVLIVGLGIASIICTVQVFGTAIQFLNRWGLYEN